MKPPVFIAIKGEGNKVIGHVRADRIEAVIAFIGDDGVPFVSQSKIRTFSGVNVLTWEPQGQVFAKMADALNLDEPEGT